MTKMFLQKAFILTGIFLFTYFGGQLLSSNIYFINKNSITMISKIMFINIEIGKIFFLQHVKGTLTIR